MRKCANEEWTNGKYLFPVQEPLVPSDFHPPFLAFSYFGLQIVQPGFKYFHAIVYLCIEVKSNEFSKCYHMFRDLLSFPHPNRQRFHV